MFCRQCGKQVTDDARFCAACGQPVAADGQEDAVPVRTSRRNTSLLWFVPLLLMVAAGAWLGGYLHKGAVTKRTPVPAPAPTVAAPAADKATMPDQLLAAGDPAAKIGCSTPAWSPDGRAIAYVKRPLDAVGVQAKTDLYLTDYEGGMSWTHRLLAKQADYPAWSRDGAQLAFNQGALCVMDVKSGKIRRLVKDHPADDDTVAIHYPLSWSADGRYLLYEAAYWEGGALFLYDFQTGSTMRVEFAQAAWMPDGRLLLVVNGDMYEEGDEYLAIFDPNTKSLKKLGVNSDAGTLFVPSEHDAYLYNNTAIQQLDLSTNRLSELQPLEARLLAWNPDGKRLAYLVVKSPDDAKKRQTELHVGQLGSRHSTLVAAAVMPDSGNWHDRTRVFAWSADGARLAYATGKGDLMIVTP